MSDMRKNGKPSKCRKKSFGNAKVLLHDMQKILHLKPEVTRIFRRN